MLLQQSAEEPQSRAAGGTSTKLAATLCAQRASDQSLSSDCVSIASWSLLESPISVGCEVFNDPKDG